MVTNIDDLIVKYFAVFPILKNKKEKNEKVFGVKMFPLRDKVHIGKEEKL